MEGVRLPSPEVWDCYSKNIFPNMLSKVFQILYQIWDHLITDIMINNIENKIENLHLQECSLKNRSFFYLEISFFHVNILLIHFHTKILNFFTYIFQKLW